MNELDLTARGEACAQRLTDAHERSTRAACRALEAALETLSRCAKACADDSGAAEWLLDNGYLAQREGHAALQALRGARNVRVELIMTLCRTLLQETDAALSSAALEQFLTGFQRHLPLRFAERALLLDCLKASVILQLAEVYAQAAPDAGRAGRLFSALRLLGALDFSELLERADGVEQRLCRDPAGIYPKMDAATRAWYREALAVWAKKHDLDECDAADALLKRCNAAAGEKRHVGWQLFRAEEKKPPTGGWYCAALLLLTLTASLLLGFLTGSVSGAVLLLLPVSELVKQCADAVLLRVTKPRFVPRLELKNGVPKRGKTLCVISALVTDAEGAARLAARLEEFALCSRDAGEHLHFGLLADLPESAARTQPGDEAAITAAEAAIRRLNETDPTHRYYLFIRPRTYVRRDGIWRGWERKRGALLSLAKLLRGQKTELRCAVGDAQALRDTQYLLTLDADTTLTPGAARSLIGAMLHPLNTPVIHRQRGVVEAGYGLLQPRITTGLDAATATDFARLYAGPGGMDVYGAPGGELYMDRYDCGGFAGKGIIDVGALLGCCGRSIPENRVLSHDALEGAYLRGGTLGEVELTDGFPATARGYFARLERWTRGDWQNAAWLFRRGRAFRPMDRLRLADNLRRALLPVGTLLAILAGLWLRWPGLQVAAWAALLSLLGSLVLSLRGVLLRAGGRVRTHSGVLHGAVLALLQALLRLVFLPMEAWVCASAAVRALWRVAISGKKLLQWQTAAQSDRSSDTVRAAYRAFCPAAIIGAAALLVSPGIAGRAAGALWLLSPLLARALSEKKAPVPALGKREQEALRGCAREIWRYFDTFCTEEDHFFPPDNWQQQPPIGAAHRTSPTNIGLGLISALCAVKLGVDGGKGLALAERMLGSMETLPKWRGHFYNWYHTITLKPLAPVYVSTVDSGNLAACLTAAQGAFREFGREDLAQRAAALAEKMDFSALYDRQRALFHIGVDAATGLPSPGWYDLFESEARLTGYLTIARGEAETRHWAALSRAQVGLDGYRGAVSWTGTMFEYLMPELFLPFTKESLIWESAKFCLHAQKRRVAPGQAWGISESGYYALDSALHYRYQAHGVAALALRRGMDRETVLSPYSTFLALMVEPRSAMRNLRRLERLGMRGPYGFYEALDRTPTRCRGGKGEVVRSFMAHHLGMSMAAICNCLLDGQVQRWMMRDPAMRAYRCLLAERVPVGGAKLRRPPERNLPAPQKRPLPHDLREGTGVDAAAPALALLSNGIVHLHARETGQMDLLWLDAALFAAPPVLRLRQDGDLRQLFPLPPGSASQWRFTEREAQIALEAGGLSATLSAAVSQSESGALWSLTLAAAEPTDAVLELVLFPALAKPEDLNAHPAFWRLGILEQRRGSALLWRRLARGDAPERWMSLACDAAPEDASDHSEWLSDGRSVVRFAVTIPADEPLTRRFAVGVGSTSEAAFLAAQQTLAMPRDAFSDLPGRLAAQLGLSDKGLREAMDMAAALTRGALPETVSEPALLRPDALWKHGVSGTLPILFAPLTQQEHRRAAAKLLRQHALLRALGVQSDLVFQVSDGGDYRQPGRQFLLQSLRRIDREDTLSLRGGVHTVPEGDSIRCCAALLHDGSRLLLPERSTLPMAARSSDRRDQRGGTIRFAQRTDGSFRLEADRALPRRAWCNVLSNGHFGCTAADSGCGDLWLENAREGRVTPWRNNPWEIFGAETLTRVDGGETASLFLDGAGRGSFTCRFGCAQWETRHARVTAFVPFGQNARVLLIEAKASLTLRWQIDLLLAAEMSDAPAVITREDALVLSAMNPRAAEPFWLHAVCSAPRKRWTCSRWNASRGQFDGFTGVGQPACFAAEFAVERRAVLVLGCGEVDALRALTDWDAAARSLRETVAVWARFAQRLRFDTPSDAVSQYLSGWGAYQALACRMFARTSLYQSGGAFGFRDQLQDAVNLLLWHKKTARSQILRCCAHQFTEGDVTHWWHSGACEHGVRTRISDDLLWLAWAIVEYAEKTGDLALLAESVAYLDAEPLTEHERERYAPLHAGRQRGSVLEHGVRAIQCVLRRGVGAHGLLRMGSGDWNDGLDRVAGESVWLSWFFSHTAHRYAALLERLGVDGAAAMHAAAAKIGAAAEAAWDGAWYRRGYYADGAPLGSAQNAACRIDVIAQSFAAFAPEADAEHVRLALQSAVELLFDREHRLVKLFDPPFLAVKPDPGYVRSYGPGFRENGGQYTHGAVWLALALLRCGRADDAWEILRALLPAAHDPDVYEAEPFVLSADVYAGDHAEQAGWSWYTGAAGWYLRTAAEALFGLTARDGAVYLAPRLPEAFPRCAVHWRDGENVLHQIEYADGAITVDGASYTGGSIGPI